MATISKRKLASVKTLYGVFACIFEHEADMGGFTAEAVNIQGAISWGKNLTEAKKMIAEAIEAVIEARAISRAEKRGLISIVNRPLSRLA